MKRSSSLAVVEMSTEAVCFCNTDYHWPADVLFSFVAYELVQHDICNVEPRTVWLLRQFWWYCTLFSL